MAKHLLRISDLDRSTLLSLLDLAAAFKSAPHRSSDLLRGDSVTLYFSKPSTRTRVSFETAIHRLGGLPIMAGPNDFQLGRGETIEDTARVISRMSRAFVSRTYADRDLERFAAAASIPVINALTDGHHPCQALADLLTLREHFGKLEGLTVAYVGAGNNVTHSLTEACALAGVNVRVGAPSRLLPDAAIMRAANDVASANGATVLVTHDAREAVDGADCIYTDTWLSMGDPPAEREERLTLLAPYRVDSALFDHAKKTAVFLHCLPAHRGEEVTDEIADHARSLIFDQAENRLHTSLAVLEHLIGRR
ncbi:MAG: ornithine carbamoyltransferase [Polyangiaceae bacterium]